MALLYREDRPLPHREEPLKADVDILRVRPGCVQLAISLITSL